MWYWWLQRDKHSWFLHEHASHEAHNSELLLEGNTFGTKIRWPRDKAFHKLCPPTHTCQPAVNIQLSQKTHSTSHAERVLRTVLSAIMNSNKKIVRVNVMLGSLFYRILRTETAAEKLALRIDPQTLTIFDTDGSKVTNLSRRLKLEVTNIETNLTAWEADAYVLENITNDTPALQWSEKRSKENMALFKFNSEIKSS